MRRPTRRHRRKGEDTDAAARTAQTIDEESPVSSRAEYRPTTGDYRHALGDAMFHSTDERPFSTCTPNSAEP
jgi:hypothetical protein